MYTATKSTQINFYGIGAYVMWGPEGIAYIHEL